MPRIFARRSSRSARTTLAAATAGLRPRIRSSGNVDRKSTTNHDLRYLLVLSQRCSMTISPTIAAVLSEARMSA